MPTSNQEGVSAVRLDSTDDNDTVPLIAPALVGITLNRRYLIEREIKRGGFGIVYFARDQQLHSRPVVVKVLLEEALQNEWIVGKFRQEIEALSRIDHPGIVGVFDAGELPDGKPYLVMEYVDGATLRSLLAPEGVSFERAGGLLKQIGRALAAAHDKGIFHRDLKPENIMIRDLGHGDEQVKVIDFGIAKVRDSALAPTTVTTNIAGTISYMAPEQLSARPVSAATDSFALGLIAYEMLTGRRPFNPETSFQLLELQRAGVRVKPGDLRPGLPEGTEEVILKALSFEPKDRYQRVRELGDALAYALTGEVSTHELRQKNSAEILPTQLSGPETLPTELSIETVPQESPTPGEPSVKTIAGRFEPATTDDLIHPKAPAAVPVANNRTWLKVVIGLVVVAALVGGGFALIRNRESIFPGGRKTDDRGKVAERSLQYFLTVQKLHNGKPYDQPFQTSGQEIFENGWKFRMNISSPQEGYLYLLNEGPAAGGVTTYNVLFPEAEINSGSPHVTAAQKLQTAWMRFDEHQGTEKFWVVWAAASVKELDDVTGTVNEQDQGEISNPDQAKAVRDFLAKHSASQPEVAKDSQKKLTTVKGKGEVLVSFVELEHH